MLGLILLCMSAVAALWVRPAPPPWSSSNHPRHRRTDRPGPASRWRNCFRNWRGSQRGHERDEAARIGAALTSVAARLRAGQSPTEAWRAAAKQLPTGAARELEALVGGPAADPGARAGAGRGQVSGALHAARAATALADDLGAELAPVLETCAAGIEESARAEAERTAAFAAPRATARLLLALPLAGIVIGSLMGAAPIGLFVSSIWGALLLVSAGALLLLGRIWIQRLLQRAENAESGAT